MILIKWIKEFIQNREYRYMFNKIHEYIDNTAFGFSEPYRNYLNNSKYCWELGWEDGDYKFTYLYLIRGSIIKVYRDSTEVLAYVDQDRQYGKLIGLGTNDITYSVDHLFKIYGVVK